MLDSVTWVDAKGGRTTVDGQATLDPDGLPATARVEVRKGRLQGTRATMQRQPGHWALRVEIGGGTVIGKLRFQSGAKGVSVLHGEFDTAQVEVAVLTAPTKTLSGRLEAQTTLRSEFRDPGTIADALQSQTRFTVRNAVVHGIATWHKPSSRWVRTEAARPAWTPSRAMWPPRAVRRNSTTW
ncbi:MAG: hypothetical protein H0X13_18475 [Ramlibacter sp.]|nr:hypothetical protein [Ramlibacter sp.]